MVQIDRGETRWGGFLVVDEDAVGLTELVGGQRAGAAYDLDIIEEAWRARRTIVSSHGDDLVRAIGEFQRREDGRACCDLRGLLIIPSDALVRDRAAPATDPRRGRHAGGKVPVAGDRLSQPVPDRRQGRRGPGPGAHLA